MGEYQEVLTKLKSTHKPTGTIKTTKPIGSESVKNRSAQEGEDATVIGVIGISAKTPVSTSGKRPVPQSRTLASKPPRSDSKESNKSRDKTVEDKKKDVDQKKKEELEKKKTETQAKKDEIDKKKKEEADKKKKQDDRKT